MRKKRRSTKRFRPDRSAGAKVARATFVATEQRGQANCDNRADMERGNAHQSGGDYSAACRMAPTSGGGIIFSSRGLDDSLCAHRNNNRWTGEGESDGWQIKNDYLRFNIPMRHSGRPASALRVSFHRLIAFFIDADAS
jgi:hypothetical protein